MIPFIRRNVIITVNARGPRVTDKRWKTSHSSHLCALLFYFFVTCHIYLRRGQIRDEILMSSRYFFIITFRYMRCNYEMYSLMYNTVYAMVLYQANTIGCYRISHCLPTCITEWIRRKLAKTLCYVQNLTVLPNFLVYNSLNLPIQGVK